MYIPSKCDQWGCFKFGVLYFIFYSLCCHALTYTLSCRIVLILAVRVLNGGDATDEFNPFFGTSASVPVAAAIATIIRAACFPKVRGVQGAKE